MAAAAADVEAGSRRASSLQWGRSRPIIQGMTASKNLVLLALLSSVSGLQAQTEEAKPSGGQTQTPSDFARFVEVDSGGHFDTAITT